ncbi:hypothetical protein [Parasphingorhabdus sp.]|uniref:hypothetical protein n=1 Tax=Parasphingorhabdus sp. TaxID=2709688 RepID=UPI00326781A0
MTEPKPFASLSSSLLARKGGAKPAMRRQGLTGVPETPPAEASDVQEDLGWNDMGYDVDPDHDAHPIESVHHNPLAGAIPNPGSAVRQQQEEIAAKLGGVSIEEVDDKEDEAELIGVPVPPTVSSEIQPLDENSVILGPVGSQPLKNDKPSRAKKSRTRKAKTAFTLRLDAERHLKLRLATAIKNVSAQQLVTKAMDEYLRTIPELDDLAERVPSRGAA